MIFWTCPLVWNVNFWNPITSVQVFSGILTSISFRMSFYSNVYNVLCLGFLTLFPWICIRSFPDLKTGFKQFFAVFILSPLFSGYASDQSYQSFRYLLNVSFGWTQTEEFKCLKLPDFSTCWNENGGSYHTVQYPIYVFKNIYNSNPRT